MNRAARWLPIAAVTLAAGAFSWWNRGERVVVDVGVASFYRAPLTLVVFLAFLAGMLAMLLLGLRHDLRLRREMAARTGPAPAPAAPPRSSGSAGAAATAQRWRPLDIHVVPPPAARPDRAAD